MGCGTLGVDVLLRVWGASHGCLPSPSSERLPLPGSPRNGNAPWQVASALRSVGGSLAEAAKAGKRCTSAGAGSARGARVRMCRRAKPREMRSARAARCIVHETCSKANGRKAPLLRSLKPAHGLPRALRRRRGRASAECRSACGVFFGLPCRTSKSEAVDHVDPKSIQSAVSQEWQAPAVGIPISVGSVVHASRYASGGAKSCAV